MGQTFPLRSASAAYVLNACQPFVLRRREHVKVLVHKRLLVRVEHRDGATDFNLSSSLEILKVTRLLFVDLVTHYSEFLVDVFLSETIPFDKVIYPLLNLWVLPDDIRITMLVCYSEALDTVRATSKQNPLVIPREGCRCLSCRKGRYPQRTRWRRLSILLQLVFSCGVG